MRYSTLFTTILLAGTCAVGMPHTSDAHGVSTRVTEDDLHWVDAVFANGKPLNIRARDEPAYSRANQPQVMLSAGPGSDVQPSLFMIPPFPLVSSPFAISAFTLFGFPAEPAAFLINIYHLL
ncbi:hypothetical protein C8R45DRAFT_1110452 [Mycena sanguinolenta]|nr:hypothetical protein C8R45DRAFT_1110452 [Mycena sanguinolenta]